MKVKANTCLVPGCKRAAKTRGVCIPCHASAMRYIRKGVITDKELIRRGWLLPRWTQPTHGTFGLALYHAKMEEAKP